MARDTERLTIALGDHLARTPAIRCRSRWTRASCRRRPGPGRFIVGFGTSKIFLNNTKQGGPPKETKPLAHMRDSVAIVRGALVGRALRVRRQGVQRRPARAPARGATRRDWDVPVYVAATAPLMQQLGGEIGDGLLTPSITTPAFVALHARERRARAPRRPGATRSEVDVGCTIVASIDATDRDRGRDGAREIAGMYLANKFQNIQGSADTLLDLAEIEMEELAPVAEAMEQRRPPRGEGAGDRLAARPLQADRRHARRTASRAIEEYRDARLHARHARALGSEPPRADPPLRASRSSRTSAERARSPIDDATGSSTGPRGRSATPSFTGDEQAMAELMRETFAGDGPAGAVAAGRGRARRTCSAPGRARAAGRA